MQIFKENINIFNFVSELKKINHAYTENVKDKWEKDLWRTFLWTELLGCCNSHVHAQERRHRQFNSYLKPSARSSTRAITAWSLPLLKGETGGRQLPSVWEKQRMREVGQPLIWWQREVKFLWQWICWQKRCGFPLNPM